MTTHADDRPYGRLRRQLIGGSSAALAAWFIGALPWIVDGLTLPISSAWPSVTPTDGVRVALPFGEYQLAGIFVATLVGGAVGPPVAQLASRRTASAWVGVLGALLGLSGALVHTLLVVLPLLADRAEAQLLVTALVLLAGAGVVLGLVAGAGLVRRTAWWSPVGGALLAATLTTWIVDLLNRGAVSDSGWLLWFNRQSVWLVAVLLAAALLWVGCRSAARLLWWPAVVAVFWIWPAVTAALFYAGSYARSGMGSGAGRAELGDATSDVFVQALLPANHAVTPYVLGVLAASTVVVSASLRARATGRDRDLGAKPVGG